ncbi:hypothetical protein E2C01_070063 [Portunus trituberculatus]|uniref:Uncharacterized protein n=1 Tax=Portunus trituberculatus TaxID=210409 RepID=A0A5B7I193_PORTR|nr:hypothetical protein [Portunus trituberculatus]
MEYGGVLRPFIDSSSLIIREDTATCGARRTLVHHILRQHPSPRAFRPRWMHWSSRLGGWGWNWAMKNVPL